MDFRHLWAAFKTRKVKEDEEVIIFWTKKHYKRYTLPSVFMPKLWVIIYPKGFYDLLINPDSRPNLIDRFGAEALMPIVEWKPEVME